MTTEETPHSETQSREESAQPKSTAADKTFGCLTLLVALPVLMLAGWGIGQGAGGGFLIFLFFGLVLAMIGCTKLFKRSRS